MEHDILRTRGDVWNVWMPVGQFDYPVIEMAGTNRILASPSASAIGRESPAEYLSLNQECVTRCR